MGESIFYLKKHYMVGYIYLITDTTNGKQYVGQHHYDKEELDSNYHGSGHIIKMIYKKRPETLKEVYLKTCYTQEELDEWEKYFIFLYNTLWPNGYNLRDGGNGKVFSEETRRKLSNSLKGLFVGEKNPFYGKKHSEETRRKISAANKGKPKWSDEEKIKMSINRKGKFCGKDNWNYGKHPSEESRRKMSESRRGENNPHYGKKMTEETKKKLLATHLGKPLSDETKEKIRNSCINKCGSKIVFQYTLDGEFIREWPSIAQINRELGFNIGAISNCITGRSKSSYGFIWKLKK